MNIAFCNWKVVLPRFRHRKATGIRKCETCFLLSDCDDLFSFLHFLDSPIFKMWSDLVKKERKEMFRNRIVGNLRRCEQMNECTLEILFFFLCEKSNTWCSKTCVDPSFWPVKRFLCCASTCRAEMARCSNRKSTSARPKVLHFTFSPLSRRSLRVSFASHRVCRKIHAWNANGESFKRISLEFTTWDDFKITSDSSSLKIFYCLLKTW